MRKIAFLFLFGLFFLNAASLRAQILNGSFSTGDLTDWQTLGDPMVVSTNPPPDGTYAVQVQSTDYDTNYSSSVPVGPITTPGTIDNTLNTTLPDTSGSNPTQEYGSFAPTNGEAIYQTFTLTQSATLSFQYSYQTNDYQPFDSVGYVLNGAYTTLVTTPPYSLTSSDVLPYASESVALGPGTYDLAFVAYNTNDMYGSTSLFVSDITVPEPATWILLLPCLGILAGMMRKKLRAA